MATNWMIGLVNEYEIYASFNQRKLFFKNIKPISLNFQSFESLSIGLNLIKPDILINCIGYTNIEQCELYPNLAYEINAQIPSLLSKACKFNGIKFIHISTDHLYDGKSSMMTENINLYKFNVYGESKIEGERLVQENNDNVLIIRTNFFGWGTTYRKSFSDYIIENLKNNNEIKLFKDVFFTPILIQELSKAVIELIELDKIGIYNVVCSERISKYEFGVKISKIFKLNSNLIRGIEFGDMYNLVKRPLDLSLSNYKLCKVLGRNIGNVDDQLLKLSSEENSFNNILIRSL